jgi:ABC-type sugar transport system ATPase subunit
VKEVSKTFGHTRAVRNVSLDVPLGEIHALVGANGAGKSTLVKILSGIVTPDAGSVEVGGEAVGGTGPVRAAFVHQDVELVPIFSGAENILLGHALPRNRLGLLKGQRAVVRHATHLVGNAWGDDPLLPALDRRAATLRLPDQQLLLIIRALMVDVPLFVFDEPTASLSAPETARFLDAVLKLKARGRAALYVTHRLEEVFQIADRVTVMRDGAVVGTYEARQLDQDDLVALITGHEIAALGTRSRKPQQLLEHEEPILRAEGIVGGAVRDATLSIPRGQVVGIAGLVGSGRSNLARLLAGVQPIESGRMLLDGQPVALRSVREASRRGVVFIPEDRRRDGMFASMSIRENLSIPQVPNFRRRIVPLINGRKETRFAEGLIRQYGVRAHRPSQLIDELSGGNQQKVVVARWLALGPKVVILDEPTQGIDVSAKAEILASLRALAAEGLGVLVVSSDFTDLLAVCDVVVVMQEGRVIETLEVGDELTKESLLHACYPAASPEGGGGPGAAGVS